MKEDITNRNSKGQYHGYQEWHSDSTIFIMWGRLSYKNGKEIGYEEWHVTKETTYYIR